MSETNYKELLEKLLQTHSFTKEGKTYKKLTNPNGPEAAKIIQNQAAQIEFLMNNPLRTQEMFQSNFSNKGFGKVISQQN